MSSRSKMPEVAVIINQPLLALWWGVQGRGSHAPRWQIAKVSARITCVQRRFEPSKVIRLDTTGGDPSVIQNLYRQIPPGYRVRLLGVRRSEAIKEARIVLRKHRVRYVVDQRGVLD
jgi:hypothetical protein